MAWQLLEWAKDREIKPASKKLILVLLADHSDVNSLKCHPSQSYLAVEATLGERQVHNLLVELAEDELISITACTNKWGKFEYNEYALLISPADLAPYLDPAKPYLVARKERAGERSVELQRRPSNGSEVPLDANGPEGSGPTEMRFADQRKRSSVKPESEPERTTKSRTPADACVPSADDAHASSGRGKPQPSVTDSSDTESKRRAGAPNLKLQLRDHLAALGDDHVLDIHDKLIHTRILPWARRQAVTELGLPFAAVREDFGSGELTNRAMEVALLALSKSGGIPPEAVDLLGAWKWPERRLPRRRKEGAAAKARKSLPFVEHYTPPVGTPDGEVYDVMIREVMRMPFDALSAKVAQLRAYRRSDSKKYEARALAHCSERRIDPTEEQVANLTLQFAIQHFRGKWPMFVDPFVPVDLDALADYKQAHTELQAAA